MNKNQHSLQLTNSSSCNSIFKKQLLQVKELLTPKDKHNTMLKVALFFTILLFNVLAKSQTLNLSKSIQGGQTTAGIAVDGSKRWYYTLQYSVSGGNSISTKITDLLPEGLTYIGTSANSGIISSTVVTTPDATKKQQQVVVNINNAAATAGSSGQVLIQVEFAPGYAYNGMVASNNATISSSNAASVTSNTVNITCIANTTSPTLTKANNGNVLDDIVTYTITYRDTMSNTRAGSYIRDAILTDVLPAGAEFIDGRLTWTSQTAIFSNDFQYNAGTHTVTFDFANAFYTKNPGTSSANYGFADPYGQKAWPYFPSYGQPVFIIRVKYPSSAGFTVGQTVTNNVNFSGLKVISNTPVSYSTSNSIVLTAPVCTGPGVAINSAINAYARQNDSAYIPFIISNTSSTSAFNDTVVYDLGAADLNTNFVTVDVPGAPTDSVSVYYATNINASYQPLLLNLSVGNNAQDTAVAVKKLGLASGEIITKVKFIYTNIPPGTTFLNYMGVVVPASVSLGAVNIPVTQSWICSNSLKTKSTNVPLNITSPYDPNNVQSMYTSKSGTNSAQIGDIVSFTIDGTMLGSTYIGPGITSGTANDLIIADLLPANLSFNAMTNTYVYFRNPTYVSGQTYFNHSLTLFALPAPTVINNYNGTGRQLVRWDLTNNHFSPFDTTGFRLVFTATVNAGTPYPSVTNTINQLLKNTSPTTYKSIRGTGYVTTDVNDLDGDGNITEQMTAYDKVLGIAAIANLQSTKKVRGSMDAAYSLNGKTVAGGVANYELKIKNTGSVSLKNITLVDVLPYVGDKYLVSQTPKGSSWSPFLAAAVSAPGGVTVYYSTVADINGSDVNTTGGANAPNWSTTLPSPITDVKAIKFEYAHNYPTDSLKAGDSLVLTWPMRVPAGVNVGDTAWNSFAYTATSNYDASILNAEPLKVPISIQAPQPNIIGNYVWNDLNNNGIQDEATSAGMNGVRVELYSSIDNIVGNGDDIPAVDAFGNDVSFTVTGNNASGNPGYYQFANLPNGNYYIKVITPTGYYITQAHIGSSTLDSDPDANGTTAMILLSGNNTTNNTIDVGLTSTNCSLRAGADITSNCLTSLSGFSITMAGVGAGVWSAVNTNPGTVSITNTSLANTTITNFSAFGTYKFVYTAGSCSDTMQINVLSKPNAGVDQLSICPYSCVTLTGTNTTDGAWSIQSNNPSSNITLSTTNSGVAAACFNANVGGLYYFIYTVGTCSDTMYVSLAQKPNAGVDLTACAGTTVQTSLYVGNASSAYPLSSNPAGATLYYVNNTGHYAVDFASTAVGVYGFVQTNYWCNDTMYITVSNCTTCINPVVNFDWQYNGNCLTYDFNSTSWISSGWITSFYWDFGNGQTSTQSNPLATFAAAGVYNVKLVVTSNLGCRDSITIPVNIINKCNNTPNSCSASWYSQVATSNCDSTLTFIANGANQLGTTYNWSFGDGATATGTPVTHKYAASGNYIVKLVVSKSIPNACTDSVSYSVYVNNCSVTGGGGGGTESKTLGDVIALRLYGNAKASKTEVNGIANGVKFTNSGAIVNGANDITLNSLMPTTVAGTDVPYVSTPTDLVNFTNAVEVLAIDYTKNNSVKAVAFGTKTLGDVYAHTKPICDRLKGAVLQEVKTINVNGYNLMAYKVQQCTGEIEYAMNLSAGTAANRNSISLQSNWFTNSYVQDQNLYNFQLWAVSYDMVKSMAQDIIAKLQANGSVNAVTATDLPKAYVTSGNRKATTVTLNINNNTNATTAIVELKEKVTETAQETSRQIAVSLTANGTSTVNLDVRDNYEATINLYVNNSKSDMLYLNDGSWALDYNKNNTTVNSFVVSNEGTVSNNTDEYRLLRNVDFSATIKDYITVYKNIGIKCQSLSLGSFNSLKFNAQSQGAGSVTVTLISSNITNWNEQYTTTINLDGRTEDYVIALNSFHSSKYNTSVNGNSITGVSFAFNSGRGVQSNMTASLSNARFSQSIVDGQLPVVNLSVYPNPTVGNRFTVNYSSNNNQSLVLKVLEVATGRVVKTMFVNATKGTNKQVVELNNTQSNGTYMVTLEGDEVKYNAVKVMMNK